MTFKTHVTTLGPADIKRFADFRIEAGEYVAIVVQDTGMGISEELHDRIFEPFFTTKEVGKGTGLGLAAVFGAVRQHKGAIALDTTIDQGTTFTLYLPAHSGDERPLPSERHEQPISEDKKCILIIDDEEFIRETAGLMLRELGYQVYACDGGKAGLEFLKSHHQRIDGILLDYTMPDMTGEQVFGRIRLAYPNIRVVLGSGFVGEKTFAKLQEVGLEHRIRKPYGLTEIDAVFKKAFA